MPNKFIDENGLLHFGTGLKGKLASKNPATASENGLMLAADKAKLDGVEAGANKYVHPAYTAKAAGLYIVTVDATGHVTAATTVTKTDITKLGIPAQDTTYSPATSAANGLMASADKAKLDGVAAGANNYVHPGYTAKAAGIYKVTIDATGHVSAAVAITKADIIALGIPAQDTTYSPATSAANGLMSAADKGKLDGFAAAGNYALKTDVVGGIKYKGSVSTYADLPKNPAMGDMYNVTASEMNYVWNGTAWDPMGGVVSIEAMTNAEIDAVMTSVFG